MDKPLKIAELGLNDRGDMTALLVSRLKELISSRQIVPGGKLPSERELAQQFGVGRPTLRNALKVLEIIGVVTQRVGDGTYLNRDASQVLSVPMEFLFLLDDISMQDLLEIRLIVEPSLAARAAQWADGAEIDALHASLIAMEESGGERLKMIEADLAFHRAVFSASGNRLAGRLFHSLHQVMLNIMLVTSQLSDPEHTLKYHRPIFKAIRLHLPEEASLRMTDHLYDARDLIKQAIRSVALDQADAKTSE